jgi:peroxiredoxin
MKRLSILLAIVLFLGLPLFALAAQFKLDPEVLSRMEIDSPSSATDKKYLGLAKGEKFTLPDIKAEIVIMEIFSMYCPVCQGEAPNVNKLHDIIQSRPDLKAKVRLIGIGTGNTPFEVEVFRSKYHVPFPLFPDDQFQIRKAADQAIRTPTFVVFRPHSDDGIAIKNIHIGKIKDLEASLKQAIKK